RAVDADDDIARLDAGPLGRRLRIDLADDGAFVDVHMHGLGDVRRQVLQRHADPAALHRAMRHELLHDAARHVDRYREAAAASAAARTDDRRVDADELAAQVDERAAGIARIDGRVGLDEVLVVLDVEAGAAERADDSGGDGLAEAEGIADGDDEIADF